MIDRLLHKIQESSALEVQFRLGQKTLTKIKNEWVELDQNSLGVSEWEDLKDICLHNSEKLQLETRGYVRGLFKSQSYIWSFSFTEYKDCLKAHFNLIPHCELAQSIHNPLFWDTLKNKKGLFIITGEKGQGKSLLIRDILEEIKKDSPKLIAVHGHHSAVSLMSSETLFHLSDEALNWDISHPVYDGVDQFIVDFNSIKSIDKWIKICEEGRSVFMTLSGLSVQNCLDQLMSEVSVDSSLGRRLFQVLNLICYQKFVGVKEGAIHEFMILQSSIKQELLKNKSITELQQRNDLEFGKFYQTLNQSIIQGLVRNKRLDVKTAFQLSNDPEDLDTLLKKMGL